MNKKEELAEYIIKNLIFIVLFMIFSFYSISLFLFPVIQNYQSHKEALSSTQFLLTKNQQENQTLKAQIQKAQQDNQKVLDSLQKGIKSSRIHSIAQDFFENFSIKEQKREEEKLFFYTVYEIKATSNGVKPIFDFIKKIKETFPNVTFSLPFFVDKTPPFSSTLKAKIVLKVAQVKQK